MAKNNNLTDFLTGVAEAIRTKKGTTELINPQDFESEIAGLTVSESELDAPQTITPTKEEQIINPSEGKVGLKQVTVAPIPDKYPDVSDANVVAADIRNGKKAYGSTGQIIGTIPDYDGSLLDSFNVPEVTLSNNTLIVTMPANAKKAILYDNDVLVGNMSIDGTWTGGTV